MRRMLESLTLIGILAVAGAAAAAPVDWSKPVKLNVTRPRFEVLPPSKGPETQALGGPVDFTLNFDANVPAGHQTYFTTAANKWKSRIPTYAATVNGPAAIVIAVSEPAIDGSGGILGSAGPTFGSTTGGYTIVTQGQMQFDSADVNDMITAGVYDEVIEHEMGHVLGIGTLWPLNSLYVAGSGQYTGAAGLAAWKADYSGQAAATTVPVELAGGSGTADGHWDEATGGAANVGITYVPDGVDFKFELMTGWLNIPPSYTSVTHRSMADLGYAPNAVVPVELLGFTAD